MPFQNDRRVNLRTHQSEPVQVNRNEIIAPFASNSTQSSQVAGTTQRLPSKNSSTLNYSTFVGGANDDYGTSVALDDSGNVVVTGRTLSQDFPTTAGVYDVSLNGSDDLFVLKLAADGTSLLYSTFVGGGSEDYSNG